MGRKLVNELSANQTVGHLTTKELVIKKHRRYWRCECVCGNTTTRREDQLATSRNPSCGCQHPRGLDTWGAWMWKGVGELGGQYYSAMQNRSVKLGIDFDVTIEELWELFIKQDRRCALTGLPLNFSAQRRRTKGEEQTASLDRIDSNAGYVRGNVWWVHKDVNRMKNAFGLDRYREICRLVTEYAPVSREIMARPSSSATAPCTTGAGAAIAAAA